MRRITGTAGRNPLMLLAAIAGLVAASAPALAGVDQPRDAPPVGVGEVPQSAGPAGARYIPGVGYRFVTPPGPRVYGYYAGPRVYGYRARAVVCDPLGVMFDRRCARRWR
jgi:hypothetical protein